MKRHSSLVRVPAARTKVVTMAASLNKYGFDMDFSFMDLNENNGFRIVFNWWSVILDGSGSEQRVISINGFRTSFVAEWVLVCVSDGVGNGQFCLLIWIGRTFWEWWLEREKEELVGGGLFLYMLSWGVEDLRWALWVILYDWWWSLDFFCGFLGLNGHGLLWFLFFYLWLLFLWFWCTLFFLPILVWIPTVSSLF